MKYKKLLSLVLTVAVSAVMLAGCTKTSGSASNTATAPAPALQGTSTNNEGGDTITIGGIAPLTGGNSMYGISASNGSKLAIDEINKAGGVLGKQINFVLLDDKGDPTEAVNAYNRLINNDKAVAIIGAVTSKPSSGVAMIAAKDRIPIITPTATAQDITTYGDNIFRACYIDPFQGKIMADFSTKDLKAKTAAVMYNTADDYSVGVAESFKSTFEAAGGTITSYEGYTAADKDFKSQLTNINQKTPDILFLSDYYNTVALIAAQAKDIGVKSTLVGADGWDGVLESVADPKVVEGAYFGNHYSRYDTEPTVANFVKTYEDTYKETPQSFAALGYDAAKILVAAIEKAGSTDKEAVIKALKESNTTGVTGNITYGQSGDPIKNIAIIQIKDGKYELYGKMNP